MELPVFNDNLRSSASWVSMLEEAREKWIPAGNVDGERIKSLVRDQYIKETVAKWPGLDKVRLENALSLISACSVGDDMGFDLNRLMELHRTISGSLPGEDVLRTGEASPLSPVHDPTPAVLLPAMLDHAFDWFSTESFSELHAVEQAALVYLRLLDMQPFISHTDITALLAAGFYTERSGLPKIVIYSDEDTLKRYDEALDAAFRMLTQPMVEFFAEMLMRTMRVSIDT